MIKRPIKDVVSESSSSHTRVLLCTPHALHEFCEDEEKTDPGQWSVCSSCGVKENPETILPCAECLRPSC